MPPISRSGFTVVLASLSQLDTQTSYQKGWNLIEKMFP